MKHTLLRKYINEALKNNDDEHRTIHGDVVTTDCDDCVSDLECRIDDAAWKRDRCPPRSDARSYYNGVLRIMRRDLRAARKKIGQ